MAICRQAGWPRDVSANLASRLASQIYENACLQQVLAVDVAQELIDVAGSISNGLPC